MTSATRYNILTALLLTLGATGSIQANPTGDRMSSANAAGPNFLSVMASGGSLTASANDATWANELGYDARALSEVLTLDIRADLDQRLKTQHARGN